MANEKTTQVSTTSKGTSVAGYLMNEAVRKSVENVLGTKDAQQFISAILSTVQTTPALAECSGKSILNAALVGHSLNLPQSPQLGYYYLVPYKNKKTGGSEAQFQMGYKGYIQLALRTGEYKKIHVTDIREGELKAYNPITDEYEFEAVTDFNVRNKLPVIGYYAFFEYMNGGKKELYWSKEKMLAHADQYSAAFSLKATGGKNPKVSYEDFVAGKVKEADMWKYSSFWYKDFDAMAYKTMLRQLISKWGLTTPESGGSLYKAYQSDMAVIDEDGSPIYVENEPVETVEAVQEEAGDIVAEQTASEPDPAETDQITAEGVQAELPGMK